MGDVWTQCQVCGKIHRVYMRFDINDNLYKIINCPHCRGDTDHLIIGDDLDDIYPNYNLNMDPRYYQY